MEPSEYQTMFQVEDRHWWYVGMQRITTRLIDHYYPQRTGLDILDAGCGTGATMAYLAAYGRVSGFDYSPLALEFCRKRSLRRLARASVNALPYAAAAFDLVVSFDVLCHQSVADAGRTLADFRRVLRPGGRLLLRLPAYNWLRGHHDVVVHTSRRFSRGELGRDLEAAGFQVEKLSYANTLLFPLALTKRLAERLRPAERLRLANGTGSDVRPNPEWQDDLLARFLFAEAGWLPHGGLPFGLTVLAVARRPENPNP